MGLNVGFVNHANFGKSAIDTQALAKVTEQILNPNNQKTVDVASLDLSKFNRVSLGTDLYAARTSGDVALQASKAATDFGINFSQNFAQNVQYLNAQAAQSLFSVKETNGLAAFTADNANKVSESEIIIASTQVNETKDMDKDKKGSNPFSFYMPANEAQEQEESENIFGSINIFA